MSANPDAFSHLCKTAYQFVSKYGKDERGLQAHCTATLAAWLAGDEAGSGLTESEASQLVTDVTRWTIKRYNPPRRKPARSREERAATELSATALLEFADEIYGKATVRNAAKIGGQSKTTVARHLRQQGIAPLRNKKIDALPVKIRWLAQILDATMPRDGMGLVRVDDLAAAVWAKVAEPLPGTAASTWSTRRKKLPEYLSAVTHADLGFHLFMHGDCIAIRRGRRIRGIKDILIWMEDERRFGKTRSVVLPAKPVSRELFWQDVWVRDVLAVMRIGIWPHFTNPMQLEPLLRLTRPLLDPGPLYHLFELAIRKGYQDDFPADLTALASRVQDPHIRKATRLVGSYVSHLRSYAEYEPHPVNYFNDIERTLTFMSRIRDIAPDSHTRLCCLRDVILESVIAEMGEYEYTLPAVLDRCDQLAELERQGKWMSPLLNT
ncbi:hypothetical protein ACFSE0_13865 [Ochrobactrum teleogrylli]|uniref:Uncharacterized protein n=1 Tax=Ochrobactrum teleogrylli TaxID=2479765 RepID=A0ABY2Y473_9HYPH|nr:hypothetical protein [[Ochrobactrum] teleogrylli]TNV16144.1 hypothetical protein FIC94_09940 [[Ochrobactrum] teleogrylli]